MKRPGILIILFVLLLSINASTANARFKRVREATLSKQAIETIKSKRQVNRIVRIKGDQVAPARGYTMFVEVETNGVIVVSGDSATDITISKSQREKIDMGDGDFAWYFCACSEDTAGDDCKFGGSSANPNLNECTGGCKCGITVGVIFSDGSFECCWGN
ncbi:MAG: hypothetical protein V3S30_08480 [Thermoanaerobaculia bacterium]